jgi:predicted ATPase
LQIELDKNYDYFSDTCIREIKSGKNKPYLLKVPNISQEKYQQASRFVSLIDAMYQKQCTIENEAKFETIFVCGR